MKTRILLVDDDETMVKAVNMPLRAMDTKWTAR